MTTGHLDAVQLAEHAEGMLEPRLADAVEAHLNECEQCRRSAAGLEAVAARLAAAPAELPTPPEVVARLDRALMAERDRPVEIGRSATPAEGGEARVVELGWFRRRAPQLLAAAATVGVLGFAGYAIATSGLGGSDAGDSGALEVTSDRAGADVPDSDAGEDGAGEDAAAENAPTDEQATTLDGAQDAGGAAPGEAPDPLSSRGALEAEVRRLVARQNAGTVVEVEPGCAASLADELGTDLVGTASTEVAGEEAVLVVFEVTDATVEAWVLPSCEAASSDALIGPQLIPLE